MKVSRPSSDRLTLRSLSWITWGVSGVLLAMGLGTGASMMGSSTFECDRTRSDRCTITHDYLLHYRTESFPLAVLQGAEVQTISDSDGEDTYRLVLLTREGPVSFPQSFSSRRGDYTSQANQVTGFVQNPNQPQVRLHQDSGWLGLLIAFSFGGVGLLVLLNSKAVTSEFNKSTNTFTLRRWGLTGTDRYSIPLHQLAGVRAGLGDRDDDKTHSARLSVVLKNGAAIPLTKYDGAPERQEQLARQISEFLRLPLLPPWSAAKAMTQQSQIALSFLIGGKAKQRTAIETSQTTLRQDPFNVEAYQRMATALSLLGEKDEAKKLLETARARCQSQGEFDKAAHLDHVLTLLRLKETQK